MTSVIDANCWAFYVEEEVGKKAGEASLIFATALRGGGIIFDNGGRMRQQYIQCRQGFGEMLLDAFLEKAALAGALKLVVTHGNRSLHQLLDSLGVPKGEHIYFETAVTADADWLVSEDIDFFEPAHKLSPAKTRLRIMEKRNGKVCKEMKKKFSLEVHCMKTYAEARGA